MGEQIKCEGTLPGVCCSVESCRYHSHGNCCTASHIDVKESSAARKSQTFCGTYCPSGDSACC